MGSPSYFPRVVSRPKRDREAGRSRRRHFLENDIRMFLSTIVVSEFCGVQEIPPEILRCCVVLPFNWDDAQRAAQAGVKF